MKIKKLFIKTKFSIRIVPKGFRAFGMWDVGVQFPPRKLFYPFIDVGCNASPSFIFANMDGGL